VGFAAETDSIVEYARKKIKSKNLDFIVANDVSRPDAGFRSETNQVTIIDRDGGVVEVPLATKLEVADSILDSVSKWIQSHGPLQ
jgi:phosphopantothenoylcysteine decarboxylase/phosphopantothenate--cysteine ligase